MAKKAKKAGLTWYGKGKRWFKTYDYKQYAVSCKQLWASYPHLMVADSKEGSEKAATAWWADKLATLTAHPQADSYGEAIETRRLIAEWCKREGQNETRLTVLEEIEAFRAAQKKGVTLEVKRAGELRGWQLACPNTLWLGDLPVDPTSKPVDGETWGARIEQIQRVINWEATQHTTSLRDLVKKFCDHKSVDVSAFRAETIGRQLMAFADFIGQDNVNAIDFEMALADYKVYLVKTSGFANPTQEQRLKVAKAFCVWLWDTAKVINECPRNLRRLTIKVTTEHEPEIWSDEEVKEILNKTSGQQKLYYLLMLNCGMYQGDIGQLKKSQVDLEAGTITRARSKTEGNGGRVVTYPLWQETLDLLKASWSEDSELVLTTRTGAPLYHSKLNEQTGKVSRKDMINTTHWQWQKKTGLRFPALKHLRKTGRNKLDKHDSHARCAIYYLAHSGQSIDDRYYKRTPEPERFAKAIKWLGAQWGIK